MAAGRLAGDSGRHERGLGFGVATQTSATGGRSQPTDDPAIELDWGTPGVRPLRMATPAQLRACRFAAGSMGPEGRGGLPVR
jgi:hypothetical protein